MTSTWLPLDLTPVLDEIAAGVDTRPRPTILTRQDGTALLYSGKVNGIHGDSGSGKSWLALLACAQVMADGTRVAYIDFEDDARTVVRRLLDLDVSAESIKTLFAYIQPDEPFGSGEPLLAKIRASNPALVVIDSTGEALTLHGARPNEDHEVARWFAAVPRRIADAGPAVLVLDHSPKASGSDLWPIGSQRKRAAINGAQFYVEVITAFNRTRAGAAKLVCAKDRHGTFRMGEKVAILQVEPETDGTRLVLMVPEAADSNTPFRPTGYMERVSLLLELATDGMSLRAVQSATSGKTDHVRLAVEFLVTEGYVARVAGPRGAHLHSSLKPFREGAQSSAPEPLNLDRDRAPSKEGGTGHSRFEGIDRDRGTVGAQSGTVGVAS